MNIFLSILLVIVAIVLGAASMLFFIWSCIAVYKAKGEPIDFKQKKKNLTIKQ